MISFEYKKKYGEIDENFNVHFPHKEIEDILQTRLDVFLTDFQPYSGDPFFTFAEVLTELGCEIKKLSPQNDKQGTVY